jgi:hypothetical protein
VQGVALDDASFDGEEGWVSDEDADPFVILLS